MFFHIGKKGCAQFGPCASKRMPQCNGATVNVDPVHVNAELPDAPEIINTSPYEDGWMIKIRMSDTSELDDLMDAEDYQAHIAEEK